MTLLIQIYLTQKFWNAIKIIFPTKTKKVCSNSCNKKDSVNKFSVFFSTIVQNLRVKLFPLMNCTCRYPGSTLSHRTDLTFSISYKNKVFIENELHKLKHKKSTGVDELTPDMLKDCASEISKPLHCIINLSIKISVIPFTWKIAKISPIFKTGNSSFPQNYRPTSVLPVLSKILKKYVHKYSVHPPFLVEGGGGVEPPTKFSQKEGGGLDRTSTLKWGCWKRKG